MEWKLAQERTISGKGVLKVPDEEKKVRAYIIYVNVLRDPTNKYVNREWNPERSRYANLVFMRRDYVIDSKHVDFDGQAFDGVNDIAGQTMIAVKCMYEGILKTFENLGHALALTPGGIGLVVGSVEDKIKDYENLRNSWDEIRVKCYADTAIKIRMYTLKYDTCDPDKDKDKPPPPPPPPPPKTSPGTPVPNSDPYNADTDDDDNTEPYPGDEPQEPTQGEVCGLYQITYSFDVTFNDNPAGTVDRTAKVWGKIGGMSVKVNSGSTSDIYLKCQGIREADAVSTTPFCIAYDSYRIGGNGQTYPQIKILNPRVTSATRIG